MKDLRGQTLSGLRWAGGGHVLSQITTFSISVFLARLLGPAEFGLMGMIAVFTGFAAMFSELGLGAALIQRKDLQDRHLSTIFWVNLATGTALTTLFVLGSPLVAAFYREPQLRALTAVTAFNFILGSLAGVQRNMLVRAMDFRKLFLIETSGLLCASVSALAAALMGAGVWTLVVQSMVATTTVVVLLWATSSWRPAPRADMSALRELLGYSTNLLGSNLINYSNRNLDNLLVGRFIGAAPLGVYVRAYDLMMLPIYQVVNIVTKVMFPAMSAIQDDVPRVKRVYMRATRCIALLTFPMIVGLLVTAEPFILFVYGEKWAAVVPLVQLFCLIGLTGSVTTTTGWIYNSQGRTDLQFRWSVFDFVLTTAAFFIGLPWGVTGIATAYVVRGAILLYPCWRLSGGLIDLRFGEMASNLSGVFFCTATMGAAVHVLGLSLPAGWPHGARLGVMVSTGVVVYAALIHLLRLEAYREAREMIAERSA